MKGLCHTHSVALEVATTAALRRVPLYSHEIQLRPEVSMQVEASEETAKALEVALKEAFSLRIPVKRAEPNSLPRFEMKARRWVR